MKGTRAFFRAQTGEHRGQGKYLVYTYLELKGLTITSHLRDARMPVGSYHTLVFGMPNVSDYMILIRPNKRYGRSRKYNGTWTLSGVQCAG